MTLSRYIAKCKTQPQPSVGYAAVTLANYIIPTDMESDLARHIITLADMFYGVSLEKCKELAYELGLRNKLKLPSSWVENKKQEKVGGLDLRLGITCQFACLNQLQLDVHLPSISTQSMIL